MPGTGAPKPQATGPDTLGAEPFGSASALIGSRQNVSARRLAEPGPSAAHFNALLELAAATPARVAAARQKAHRASLLMLAAACLQPRVPDIPAPERMESMGAAIQNLLLGAHAMGFGAGLTSGQAMASPRLAALLRLLPGEVAVCGVNVGTVSPRGGPPRQRPGPASFTTVL